jgi:hypothetical protein
LRTDSPSGSCWRARRQRRAAKGHIRANPSEERMDRLLIRSDVRLGTYLGQVYTVVYHHR